MEMFVSTMYQHMRGCVIWYPWSGQKLHFVPTTAASKMATFSNTSFSMSCDVWERRISVFLQLHGHLWATLYSSPLASSTWSCWCLWLMLSLLKSQARMCIMLTDWPPLSTLLESTVGTKVFGFINSFD